MKKTIVLFLGLLLCHAGCTQQTPTVVSFDRFGCLPDTKDNASDAASKLIAYLQSCTDTTHLTVTFPAGTYHFHEEGTFVHEYYISNHDQDNPKRVAFPFEYLQNITFDGQGSEFIFHGRMIPFALLNGKNITLKNFSIDFAVPALRQLQILDVNRERDETMATIYPSGHYRIDNGRLILTGESFEIIPTYAMAFTPDKRLTYRRQDVSFRPESVTEVSPDTFLIRGWDQTAHTAPGERFVLRSGYRPTPTIFVSECTNTSFENIRIRYAEGMGLLAQMSENITLDGFNVCLRGDDDPRFFTTQADATHFSGCKGLIVSKNGLYEHMADDAINVHGTYLRVTRRIDDHTLHARYMHHQAWGFKWGEPGDSVQFVESERMETIGNHIYTIRTIKPVDRPTEVGAKEFEITFVEALPAEISEAGKYGVENLTWTPEVVFSDNIVRNNRARGALFSTPRRVVCENNLFDHTHGTAILLCGDCNGWYETGACKDVTIRNNRFVNALTGSYQFTNAVISIYPKIPDLDGQERLFHSGIVIEDNLFETFDHPLLYAKSTDGITFRNNKVTYNTKYEPFHWNTHLFFFEKVRNVTLEGNHFGKDFDPKRDILINRSPEDAVSFR
ncbi:right-handed parallel beta-helix repeat-containing protein [Tannerella sp.]|uniref:right-handed parallel beta-helix repeat-containing protein n=1 Tax=Tannerella sp. TaxID=2382127 RepID=UPI0026DCE86A|nr:right-handed parallel beta-helix repeat-containing protein [Tannerella sp.]MDO4703781.1 right-handed parallel beta-helix repeat-containing protein [Tannerella sp.]